MRSPSRRCHSHSGTGDAAGRFSSGSVAVPSCGENANVAGNLAARDQRGEARQPADEDARVRFAKNQRVAFGIPPGDARVDARVREQRGLDAEAVHRGAPLGAGQVGTAEQAMELGGIRRQPRVDEHAVARIAACRFEQQVRADLEVVVHAIAQAVRVDERDRGQRQLARVEADAAAVTAEARAPGHPGEQGGHAHRRDRIRNEERPAGPEAIAGRASGRPRAAAPPASAKSALNRTVRAASSANASTGSASVQPETAPAEGATPPGRRRRRRTAPGRTASWANEIHRPGAARAAPGADCR